MMEQAGLDFAKKTKAKKHQCTIDEAFVIQRMIIKHGDDWEGMKKDLKQNKFMWTAKFCENKANDFKNVYPNGI